VGERVTYEQSSGSSLQAHLVALPDAGSSLHRRWQHLAETAAEPVVFNEPDFVLAAARHLDPQPRLGLLMAADQDGLAFALPVQRTAGYRRLPLPAITAWRHDYCFLTTPLVRPGVERLAWEAVLGLLAHRVPWLVLEELAADGPVWDGLQEALASLSIGSVEGLRYGRAVARRRSEETYLSGVRGVHLKSFRRQRRALGREVSLRRHVGDAQSVEAFLELESAGWKGHAGGAMAMRPGHADLLREVVCRAPELCEVFALVVDGVPVALQVNLRRGRVSFCFKTTYDEVHRRQSPGLLLMLEVLSAFHADAALDVLDSCAVAGHPMAERLLPDRRPVVTLVVPFSVLGRFAAHTLPLLIRLRSRVKHKERPWSVSR